MARVTLKHVAAEAQVSYATVSRVLNDVPDPYISAATREKVLAVARAMGYRAHAGARALVKGKTDSVTLVTNRITPYVAAVAATAKTEMRRYGSALNVHVIELETMAQELESLQSDGLILLELPTPEQGTVSTFLPGAPPLVSMGVYHGHDCDVVAVSLYEPSLAAMRHLEEQGCRRIWHATNQPVGHELDERGRAYAEALRARGLPTRWIRLEQETQDHALAVFRQAFREDELPDGIFCRNDEIALAALRAAHEVGLKVPNDLAVVGCDDIPASRTAVPSLSTIRQPLEAASREACALLLERIGEPSRPLGRRDLSGQFLPRESSSRR